MTNCVLCRRSCGINREEQYGKCGVGSNLKIALADHHYHEEPVISGQGGSGTIFFSGCSLGCVFCQNHQISHEGFGQEITVERLGEIMLELEDKGAENINLVTPTHYIPPIIQALDQMKHKLSIPVVYNTSCYESLDSLKALEGYVEVYLPDLKFCDGVVANRYIGRRNYFEGATENLQEMFRQVGAVKLGADGLLKKGLLIRHLVMPSLTDDSLKIISYLADHFPLSDIYFSLMGQYLPYGDLSGYPEINRPLHPIEYHRVQKRVEQLGFMGYTQSLDSAIKDYTPIFDLRGV